ncbi:hypothetical protein CONPUDRAFT_48251 [Coniophora puteana RWD-64-598 SS2]|uniref:Uncharacterized protein n=1 Tax=Coniophora puteana (strain RWD-64-598) TaxID=741705 RepID=A0A5M3N1E0_CONPW|nr:uncharacterized protein CONPUDRAFT_48251 [Coniophora puteana RWD-64-598 SS2]EIW85126.1 hypothetical protein CONPUDRAFT_48251 [Coniophora puteana RWD-64-598 SS2]
MASSPRTLDPILGIFTGCFAYYLYETNPRTERPPEQRLVELVRWKMQKGAVEGTSWDSEGS